MRIPITHYHSLIRCLYCYIHGCFTWIALGQLNILGVMHLIVSIHYFQHQHFH